MRLYTGWMLIALWLPNRRSDSTTNADWDFVANGCKSGTKNEINSENGIDKIVYEMWNDFTEINTEFNRDDLPLSTYFHNN